IADSGRVREISAATGIIATVAGNGARGYSGDNGPATAASFSSVHYPGFANEVATPPTDIAVDSAGNLYIADAGANRIRAVRDPSSTIPGFRPPGAPTLD